MGRKRPRITVKEKILVHLLDYERYSDAVEVPLAMTQKGMAAVVDVPRSHIALTLGGMLEEKLVELEKLRVTGESRRQNAYFLTHQGHQRAVKLRAFFNETVVELVADENAGEITSIGDILKDFPHLGLIRVLNLLAADPGSADSRIDVKDLERAKTVRPPAEPVKEEPVVGTEVPVPPPPPPPPVEVGAAPPVGPIMAVFRTVECLNCRRTVALQFDGDVGYVACPLCGRGPLVEKSRKEKRWAVPLAMGLGLSIVLGSLLLALTLPEACLLYPLGALIGFLLFLWGLSRMGDHDDVGRRALYGAGSTLALASIIIFGLVLEFYDLEGLGNICLVCLPPLLVLLLPRPIPKKQRFCISVVLAVLLIMLGFAVGLGLDVAGWDPSYSVLWVGFGLTSMLLAKELKIGLDMAFWPLMLFSSGIFIVGSVCLTLILAEFRVSMEHMAAIGAWFVLGLFLISAMAERNNWNERVVQAMRHGSAFSLGFGFGFFGVILFIAGKYLEGIVEVGIGLPLLWYGAKDAIGNLLPSRLFTIVLLSLVEVATIMALVWP